MRRRAHESLPLICNTFVKRSKVHLIKRAIESLKVYLDWPKRKKTRVLAAIYCHILASRTRWSELTFPIYTYLAFSLVIESCLCKQHYFF